MDKKPDKSSSNKFINKGEQEVAPGKKIVTAACTKDNFKFKFLFEPWPLPILSNNSQQYWANNNQSCCVCLHVVLKNVEINEGNKSINV